MNQHLDLRQPEQVQQFLQSWSELNVRPESYPLTLEDAQHHADAFMRAAGRNGISQAQIQDAIHGRDLRDVMVLAMRNSVEHVLDEAATEHNDVI